MTASSANNGSSNTNTSSNDATASLLLAMSPEPVPEPEPELVAAADTEPVLGPVLDSLPATRQYSESAGNTASNTPALSAHDSRYYLGTSLLSDEGDDDSNKNDNNTASQMRYTFDFERPSRLPAGASPTALKSYIASNYYYARPLREFLPAKRLRLPRSLAEYNERITANANHYQGNYVLIALVLLFYMLYSNILFILVASVFGLVALKLHSSEREYLVVLGRRFATQQLLMLLGVLALCTMYIMSAFSTLLWIGLLFCAVVLVHGVLFEAPVATIFGD